MTDSIVKVDGDVAEELRNDIPAEPKKSIRETLEENFEKLEARQDDEDTDDAESGEPTAKKRRERDATGKFLAKTKDFEARSSGEVDTTESVTPSATESTAYTTPVLPPPGWAADARETFNQLPPRLQQEVYKRETDLRRGLQQATENAAQVQRTWGEVEQVLSPHMERFNLMGVSPGRVVNQFMAWQQKLDSDPADGLRQLAQSYGLDLRQLAEQEAQTPQEPPYIRELRQQNQQLMGLYQQTQQRQQMSHAQALANEVQGFVEERDGSGNPVRPYMEHLIEDMVPLVQHMRSQNPHAHPRQLLQAAYEKAIWLNDSTREIELKKSQTQPMSKQTIDKARKAQKLVNGEARSDSGPVKAKGLRATLEANWEKLNSI